MWIAGAGRGLGARLMVEVTLDPIRGVGPLRNEKPRMGVRGVVWRQDGWPTRKLLLGAGFGRLERRLLGRPRFRGVAVCPPDW